MGGDRERGKGRFKTRGLLADEGCSRAIFDFLSITDVARLNPRPAKEDTQSEARSWNPRRVIKDNWSRKSTSTGLIVCDFFDALLLS